MYQISYNLNLTILLVCLFGVIKKFHPITPFLTIYLEGSEYKNFTNPQLYGEIYPYSTYSHMFSLVPAFFLSDYFRYKPLIVVEVLVSAGTYCLLVYGETVFQMQIMQIFYGISESCEVAYSSYLYALVDIKQYKQVTSYFRTAVLIGKFLAFLLAQLIVWTKIGSLLLLNEISMYAMIFCVILALFFPNLKQVRAVPNDGSIKLTKKKLLNNDNNIKISAFDNKSKKNLKIFASVKKFLKKLLLYYLNPTIFCWSLWWIVTTCGTLQIFNYIQMLWSLRHKNGQFQANGLVESAFLTFVLQYLKFNWEKNGKIIFIFSSCSISLVLYAMIFFENIFVDYASYLYIACSFCILIAVAGNLIAQKLRILAESVLKETELDSSKNRHYLFSTVFGINDLIALTLQSILTRAVADKNGLFGLDIEEQFIVYSIYFLSIGILFFVLFLIDFCKTKCLNESESSTNNKLIINNY